MALALHKLPQIQDPRVIVGNDTADDAGVFIISPDRALVHTVDLLAPVADDPYTYGRIAAANCLSDIYAMGGTPLSGLNVVGFPRSMDMSILTDILRGGQDTMAEAGAAMLGGHTFHSEEIRYGIAVTGEIHPDRIFTNAKAQPGDKLILTKPIGSGTVLACFISKGAAPGGTYQEAMQSMMTTNRAAMEVVKNIGANSVTDVTGFSLLGHGWEMAQASGVGFEIYASKVPTFDMVLGLIHDGIIDGSYTMNLNSFEQNVVFEDNISKEYIPFLYSSETSGGLLISVPEDNAHRMIEDLHIAGMLSATIIGDVVADYPGKVKVVM